MDVFDPAVGLEKSKRMFEEAKQRNTEKTVKRREASESEDESEAAAEAAAEPPPPATAAEVMKQLGDHIGSIYEHYLSTRNCPPDFHGLHEHLYFHHEVGQRAGIFVLKHESSIFRSFIPTLYAVLEMPSQFSMGQTVQSPTSSIMEKPLTGFMNDLNMLLSCFG